MSQSSKSQRKSKSSKAQPAAKQQRKPAPRRPIFLPCRVDELRSAFAGAESHVSRRLPDPAPALGAEYVANWRMRQVA